MRTCMSEGDLRAWVDGEGRPEAQGHLQACGACRERLAAIEARAQRVGVMISALEPESAALPRVRRVRRGAVAAAAGAIAASVVLVFALGKPPKAPPPADDFLVLDDTPPLQMGLVVRMDLPAETGSQRVVQADVVIGEDGRLRAIRFID